MDELDSIIRQINEEFGEGTITTANEIPRPQSSLDREAFDDFNTRNPMAGGGMLVQPSVDGSRPGYKDDKLPDFITKNEYGTYRVRSKKTKSNKAVSKSFKTLKEAKAFVREKNLVKSKTGVEFPELVAKAQGVVDDYNKLVESAVKKNDLRGIKFFEGYVKDRFKKTSDQNQILRQVYKKKLNYTDLTQVRKSVAKNLITEVMDMETIVPKNYIYNLLGGKNGLKSDTIKIVSNGLKNQTKIKVDNAIEAIVEADEIIDDSFIKTVANRIGKTQFGTRTGEPAAWRKALENNSYYKKNKELLDYAFTAGAKRTRAVGMSLKEILDDAKYKKGGGVTFSGKQTQFTGLRRYIFDYAKTHWHRNNFDGNPEKSLIEFYDKNGKPITWKSGLKLPISSVQFKIPSESDIMWSYSGPEGGGPKGSVSVTGKIADASGIFREVTETYNIMKDISDAEVTNPITKQKTTYNDLVSKIYKDGYGYTGTNIFGLDMDHFKGVKEHPFKNLRAMDRKLNISLGAIDRTFDNRNLKAKLKNEMLGELATKKGGAYNTALKNYFVNQATQVLEKGAVPTLITESPYYAAVKNVYEQRNLPKVQKELLEKSYQRAIKLENSLLEFAGTITDQCGVDPRPRKAEGGRINFVLGANQKRRCLELAKEGLENGLKKGFNNKQQMNLAEVILKGGRSLGSAFALKNLLGPAAIGFTVLAEAGLVGYDMLSEGKTFREAVGDSLFNYALGEKTKIDPQEELFKRFEGLGYDNQQMFRIKKALDTANTINTGVNLGMDIVRQKKKVDELGKQYEQDSQQIMMPEDEMMQSDQLFRAQKDLQNKFGKMAEFDQNLESVPVGDTEAPIDILNKDIQSGDYAQGLELFSNADRLAEIQKTETALDRALSGANPFAGQLKIDELRNKLRELKLNDPRIREYMGPFPTTYGFAGGGIAGLSGGDPEGAMTRSMNPDSQGLSYLFNRVKKT